MDLPSFVLVIAALLGVVSLAEPVAQRLHLPLTVVLALVGLAIGAAAGALAGSSGPMREWAQGIGDLPLSSHVFLFIFLPALLFQAALETDVRDMAGEAGPILLMAVVAVLVATLAIGFGLWPFAGVPLIACMLLGAIVATTDPSAVIGIFRDLGAPQRLTRLVEGESLLNDAVAITLFVIFTDMLVTGHTAQPGATAIRLLAVPLGGALLGYAVGRLFASFFTPGNDNRLVQVSLTLALPYLVFVLAEEVHVSGPLAVVTAGIVIAAAGPSRISPSTWRYVQDIWHQLAFWASSLVFILAAILVPRLVGDFGARDFALLAVLTAMALLSRAAVIFGFMPLLSRFARSTVVSTPYKLVMWWGGLRGAATLALALAVTENPALPPDVKRFVAVLATAFVLFTLLVPGLTLRPLMRALGLDKLSPVDASMRRQALAWSNAEVRKQVGSTAIEYALSPQLAASVATDYANGFGGENRESIELAQGERIVLALAALAAREQDIVRQHLGDRTASPRIVGLLLVRARRLLDAARLDGAEGYAREAARALAFSRRARLANTLHTRFGYSPLLERQLATRFELLLVNRMVVRALNEFAERTLSAVFGSAIGAAIKTVLAARREETTRALDALRLQYPEYAEALELRFLRMSAWRAERDGYDRLFHEGLIGPEVRRTLIQEVDGRIRRHPHPRLDLKLDVATLLARVTLFESLSGGDAARDLRALMRPVLAMPGQRLITRGEQGDAAWFIASGAVEVDTGQQTVRLGRGDFFGELALLTGEPRRADVTAIGFCEMLQLRSADFRTFLERHPAVRAQVEAVAAERLGISPAQADGARLDSAGELAAVPG